MYDDCSRLAVSDNIVTLWLINDDDRTQLWQTSIEWSDYKMDFIFHSYVNWGHVYQFWGEVNLIFVIRLEYLRKYGWIGFFFLS